MNIKVTSDSTCDLSQELLDRYQISLFPLHVNKAEKSFLDGVDIFPQDIFDYTDSTGKLCSTSALNVAEYRERFVQLSPQYDAVIHINISAEFSSCYQNACTAAAEFDNIFVVDSRNLSSGQGHVVIEAAKMAQAGMEPEKIVAELQELTGRVEASFIMDRLDYMVKGGRCSAVAALGANLLRLKPCIEVKDGKMQVAKKYRGSYLSCLESYVTERLSGRTDILYERIFITFPVATQQELDRVHAMIEQNASFREVYETHAGCTVSCHCGPKTLGVLFIRKK